MKKNLFFKLLLDKDVLFSTLFVFAFIAFLKFLPIHLDRLDPLEKAFKDFDFSDIAYLSVDSNPPDINSHMVMVNIGNSRAEIARQVSIINQYQPAVVAVDAYFRIHKDEADDSTLLSALSRVKNLVVGCKLQKKDSSDEPTVVKSFSWIKNPPDQAYLNFVAEDEKTIRLFKPSVQTSGDTLNCFAAEIVKKYDAKKYEELMARKNEFEYIRYTQTGEQYIPTIGADEIKEGNPALEILRDKIVIIGKTDKGDISDMHFTPLNNELAGRSKPDMAGIFIHANIINMILTGKYIYKVPLWLILVISFLITYFSIMAYVLFFVENHIWFHLFSKSLQLVFTILLLYLEIEALHRYRVKFDDAIILIPVILSVDLLYFYDGIVKWLHKHFGYKTYFMNHP